MITGASGEFGTEIAHALVRAGTKVVLVGCGYGRLRTLAEKLEDDAAIVEGDVSQSGEPDRIVRSVADEHGQLDILVDAADTGLGDRMIEELAAAQGVSGKEVRDCLVGSTPLGRLARPDGLAAAAPFYASDLSAFITGTSLTIGGGAHRAIA
jgi:NAD(P)-dependent dehydrogenase (short-subunit alcohol dehydrogenase family)